MVTEYSGTSCLPGGSAIKYNKSQTFYTNVQHSISTNLSSLVKQLSKTNFVDKIKFLIVGRIWASYYIEINYSDPKQIEKIMKENGIQYTRIDIGSFPSNVYFCFSDSAVNHMRIIQ